MQAGYTIIACKVEILVLFYVALVIVIDLTKIISFKRRNILLITISFESIVKD